MQFFFTHTINKAVLNTYYMLSVGKSHQQNNIVPVLLESSQERKQYTSKPTKKKHVELQGGISAMSLRRSLLSSTFFNQVPPDSILFPIWSKFPHCHGQHLNYSFTNILHSHVFLPVTLFYTMHPLHHSHPIITSCKSVVLKVYFFHQQHQNPLSNL